VFVLPDGITDHESFLRAATALLPFDPPWYGRSWDAFDDSLWEGLYELPERLIAILWPDATTLAGSDPKTYEMVLDCLEDVSEGLADAKATVGNPKDLAVVVGT
jgi:Barstar (barnase inhibitor)